MLLFCPWVASLSVFLLCLCLCLRLSLCLSLCLCLRACLLVLMVCALPRFHLPTPLAAVAVSRPPLPTHSGLPS